MSDHPYRDRRDLVPPKGISVLYLWRLDRLAREVRTAVVSRSLGDVPLSTLTDLAIHMEEAIAQLARRLANGIAVMTALIVLFGGMAGLALRLFVGWWGIAVAGFLLTVAFVLGLMLALFRMSEAILVRATKAHEELSRYILTRPEESTPTRVRVSVSWLSEEERQDVKSGSELDAQPSTTDPEKAKKP